MAPLGPDVEAPKTDGDADAATAQYVVVLRASSGVRIAPEDGYLSLVNLPTPLGPLTVSFRTLYTDEGFDERVPRGLWADVRGPGLSLQAVQESFWRAAYVSSLPLSLSANAPIDRFVHHLAFDNTPGRNDRPFVQHYLPPLADIPRQHRRLNVPATLRLLEPLSVAPSPEPLFRAMSLYHLALLEWLPGQEIQPMSHLYIAAEGMTDLVIERHCAQHAVTRAELARSWSVKTSQLGHEARRRLIFQGDEQVHKAAKDASDLFEHGRAPFQEVRALTAVALAATARYVRQAIIDLIGVEPGARDMLLGPPYDERLEWWPLRRELHGSLGGRIQEGLPQEYPDYPLVDFQVNLAGFRKLPVGRYDIDLTVQADWSQLERNGFSFTPAAHEIWGPQPGAAPAPWQP